MGTGVFAVFVGWAVGRFTVGTTGVGPAGVGRTCVGVPVGTGDSRDGSWQEIIAIANTRVHNFGILFMNLLA
jgi:hypothetical protein